MMRRFRRAVVAAVVVCGVVSGVVLGPRPGSAAEVGGLYQADVIVTGRGQTEQQRGFRKALAEVVIKLSGDADIVGTDAILTLVDRAGDFVGAFDYEDRMKGLKVHDGQGIRECPHYLRVTFDRGRWTGRSAISASRSGAETARGLRSGSGSGTPCVPTCSAARASTAMASARS